MILVLNTGAQLVKFTFSDSSFFPVFLKMLKRLFSVNYVSPTSWQTVAEITMELSHFIKIFKKGCLWRMGLALNKLYINNFFRKQSLLIIVMCFFCFLSLRSPRPSVGAR